MTYVSVARNDDLAEALLGSGTTCEKILNALANVAAGRVNGGFDIPEGRVGTRPAGHCAGTVAQAVRQVLVRARSEGRPPAALAGLESILRQLGAEIPAPAEPAPEPVPAPRTPPGLMPPA